MLNSPLFVFLSAEPINYFECGWLINYFMLGWLMNLYEFGCFIIQFLFRLFINLYEFGCLTNLFLLGWLINLFLINKRWRTLCSQLFKFQLWVLNGLNICIRKILSHFQFFLISSQDSLSRYLIFLLFLHFDFDILFIKYFNFLIIKFPDSMRWNFRQIIPMTGFRDHNSR